jgi:hypothetical protein
MSIWTQVTAELNIKLKDNQIKLFLGKTYEEVFVNFSYEDDYNEELYDKIYNEWKKSDEYIPCGSEGGLDLIIKEFKANQCLVSIFGGLRDYSNYDEIMNYFNILSVKNYILNGTIEIKVSYEETVLLEYDFIKKSWSKI